MSDKNGQVKITREDMEKIQKSAGGDNKEAKPKMSVGALILRIVGATIAVVYFVLLIFGRFFLPPDGEFMTSLNPFFGAENPNRVIRIISLCILTLSISFVLRFIIKKMAASKGITKRTGVAVIELIGSTVKYVAYLVLIFLILNAAGVNTTELLAGLGILSLILGLGMTSLIEDSVILKTAVFVLKRSITRTLCIIRTSPAPSSVRVKYTVRRPCTDSAVKIRLTATGSSLWSRIVLRIRPCMVR